MHFYIFYLIKFACVTIPSAQDMNFTLVGEGPLTAFACVTLPTIAYNLSLRHAP